jgi:hypothetical protein
MGIWHPLMAAAQRGELSPELDERFAWEVLLGRDRSINAFALPGGFLGVHLGLIGAWHTRRAGLGAGARTQPRHPAPHCPADRAGQAQTPLMLAA